MFSLVTALTQNAKVNVQKLPFFPASGLRASFPMLKALVSNAFTKTVCFTFLPPRFLLLVELWALPCPSILLLPTQPPITVPSFHTEEKNHQSFHLFATYSSTLHSNVIMSDKQSVQDNVDLYALYENHHQGVVTAQHSLFP